jgi:hypothetical protein
VNDSTYLDVVLRVDNTSTTGFKAYKCKVSHTSGSTFDASKWDEFSANYESIATSVLLANGGYIKVLSSGSIFVGNSSDSYGWLMTGGAIRHTRTNLTLTADGNITLGNGDLMFSANHIIANGLRIDPSGNLVMSGAVNNGELRIGNDNIGDYIYGGFLDVLRCPPTVILGKASGDTLPNTIELPFAYLSDVPGDNVLKIGGATKLDVFHEGESGTWYAMNMSDMRSMVGRKIRIYKTPYVNPEIGLHAPVMVYRQSELDYSYRKAMSEGDEYDVNIGRQLVFYPGIQTMATGVGIPERGMLELTCKRGNWNGAECIYWEAETCDYQLEWEDINE